MREVKRRRFVGLLASAGVTLAGCLGGDETGGATTTNSSTTETGTTPPDSDGTATETANGGLDLREANVVGVEVEPMGDSYRFSVTLYHDDDGEEGYTNWWQIETLSGERLGRRELSHPHGTTRFTRSKTIEIPSSTNRVVVRGHDQTHGYGGRAMVVTLDTGEMEIVKQGPKPQEIEGADSGSMRVSGTP